MYFFSPLLFRILFERCRKEKRNLVTTSKTLLVRKDCPPGTYLVNPSTIRTLEETLVQLLLLHGVTLIPDKFLTKCVVCNGRIIAVLGREEQKGVFKQFGCPDVGEDLDNVFKCDGCGQGYWWSSSPSSSASRVKDVATHLLKLCLKGGVQIEGQPEFFAHVDYDAERRIGEEERCASAGGWAGDGVEEVVNWLKDKHLSSPFSFKSAYASETNGKVDGELLPFTNVTSDFVGALDYILFEESALRQTGRLVIPTDFRTLNAKGITNGHILPSAQWPSDHLCIGAQFALEASATDKQTSENSEAISPSTGIPSAYVPDHLSPTLGCACGCVPKILSMFQMAELRKQARLKKEAEKRE